MDDFRQFTHHAANYNVIPLVRERLADRETTISMVSRLRQHGQERLFLLESVEGGEKWGRYSIIGLEVDREIVIREGQAILVQGDRETPLPGNPVDALQAYLAKFQVLQPPGLPRFFGGAVGYFAFSAVRFFERCGEVPAGDPRFPEGWFMLADQVAVIDNVSHTIKLVCCVHPEDHANIEAAWVHGQTMLDRMEALLLGPAPTAAASDLPASHDQVLVTPSMAQGEFEAMVRRAQEYIRNGDIIQVVLAQHFRATVNADAFDVYRALRYVNPSPYLYYLQLDRERAIAGSSPEAMVRVTHDMAETRPIAGTRPRGRTEAEDRALAAELLLDPKERAEHVMLVDLARNDLGRIAEIGSVEVTSFMEIERYSHVMHIVSNVRARLRPEYDALSVFKATFPAGTLSGAPKVRAMEIIHELEPSARGPYGGALGYIAYGGRVMDMAITIRTVLMDGHKATVTAGAGIVFDSVPEREYQETLHKSQGMRKALVLAQNGLRLAPPKAAENAP